MGVLRLSNMKNSIENIKRTEAIVELVDRPKKSSALARKLNMTSRQISSFLKDDETVERKKFGGKRYKYYVDLECPSRIEFGDEWIEIEEVEIDGKMYKKVTSSQGEEKLIF